MYYLPTWSSCLPLTTSYSDFEARIVLVEANQAALFGAFLPDEDLVVVKIVGQYSKVVGVRMLGRTPPLSAVNLGSSARNDCLRLCRSWFEVDLWPSASEALSCQQ